MSLTKITLSSPSNYESPMNTSISTACMHLSSWQNLQSLSHEPSSSLQAWRATRPPVPALLLTTSIHHHLTPHSSLRCLVLSGISRPLLQKFDRIFFGIPSDNPRTCSQATSQPHATIACIWHLLLLKRIIDNACGPQNLHAQGQNITVLEEERKKKYYLSAREPLNPPSSWVSMSRRWLIFAITASACVPEDESRDDPDSPLFMWLPPPYAPSPDIESLWPPPYRSKPPEPDTGRDEKNCVTFG